MSDHLSAAARAALGAPSVDSPQPQRLVWVLVEDRPAMTEIIDPNTGQPLGRYAQHDAAEVPLTDLMADKFREVCDGVDWFECQANVCVDSMYEREGVPVGKAIGWVLAGEADERVEWNPVALVQHGRKVIAVCAVCSPESFFIALYEQD